MSCLPLRSSVAGRIWICYSEETPVSDDLVTLICCLLCDVSGFEEWLVAVCCAADVERLLMGTGFQGPWIIFLSVLNLKVHWLLWLTWGPVRMKTVFLVVSCLTFLVPLPSSLTWKMEANVQFRRLLQPCGFPAWLISGQRTFWHSLPPNSVCCNSHGSCFIVVNNNWFRKVRGICGFHSSSLPWDSQSEWCAAEECWHQWNCCSRQPCMYSGTDSGATWSLSGRTRPAVCLWDEFNHLKEMEACMINGILFCLRSWQEWGR